ncbi:nucleotidyltransferase domain-containing protein, partial [Candidatus Sordicultor fermentans]|uniref:nucleotidyltransferase domain-containing protein n=1 Tax=Candidatus Sordicultor fermentans TaxID=1953203 RepID=UPI0016B3CC47|nr:nucleotidyltransferase domain-containing protein [Candidatus Atribacteria bacterium]
DILRIGVFGSYNAPFWGVGSDLDVVVVLRRSPCPFWERSRYFDTMSLPVSVDLLVYTEEEFEKLEGRFAQVMQKEVRWP